MKKYKPTINKYEPELSKSHHQRIIKKSFGRTEANREIEKQLRKENVSNFIIIEGKDGVKRKLSVKAYHKMMRDSLNSVRKAKNNLKKQRA